jgi:hypothetical protein
MNTSVLHSWINGRKCDRYGQRKKIKNKKERKRKRERECVCEREREYARSQKAAIFFLASIKLIQIQKKVFFDALHVSVSFWSVTNLCNSCIQIVFDCRIGGRRNWMEAKDICSYITCKKIDWTWYVKKC